MHFINATKFATSLMGNAISANLFLVGYAIQKGLFPISLTAVERAIELNGVSVDMNKESIYWGRLAAIDINKVKSVADIDKDKIVKTESLETVIKERFNFLIDYQDEKYAKTYKSFIDNVIKKDNNDNLEELENLVRGSGSQFFGRLSLEEILSLYSTTVTTIKPKHSGLAFILNKTYRSSMSPIELLEATRGTWSRPPRDQSIRFAYATYHNIVKEVYKIEGWLPAGTQQYFFRDRKLGDERLKKRWEFIGRIADDDVRNLYLRKKIRMKRSYGTPFQRV